MSTRNFFPGTFSLKRFDDDPTPDVEQYVSINAHTIVFNADLVESFGFTKVDALSASIRLHLRDGSPEDRHFVVTKNGIVERHPTQASLS